MTIGIGCVIVYVIQFVLLIYMLYVLRFQKLTNKQKNALVTSVARVRQNDEFKRVVLVQVDFNSQPYVNDKYIIYNFENNDLVLDQTTEIPLPRDFTYDYASDTFKPRELSHVLDVKFIDDRKLDYGRIGVSEISPEFAFTYQRRVSNLSDTEFKIVRKNPCYGNANKILPLYRDEYLQQLKISSTNDSHTPLLVGYKQCIDENRYRISQCVRGSYFHIPTGDCISFDGEPPIFVTQKQVVDYMNRPL